ncbi:MULTISPECIES: hypothetical protein [Acinetobacter]|uniref:hypothetical protein n=1 Tax=Acinetobacter TaxID=469 RepID=UPI0030168BFB
MIFEVVTLVVLIIAFIVSLFLSVYLIKKSRVRKNKELIVTKREEQSSDINRIKDQLLYQEYLFLTLAKKYKRHSMQEIYISNKFEIIFDSLAKDSLRDLSIDTDVLHVELFPKTERLRSELESEIEINRPSYAEARKFIEPPIQQFVH